MKLHPNQQYHYLLFLIPLLSGYFLLNRFHTLPGNSKADKDEIKSPNKLYPQELFFLDKNYPFYSVPKDLYQKRISQAIRFDQSNPPSRRGLDHPWTIQGPGNIGGRVNTIAIDPNANEIILLGYSQGGIYQTKDGGSNWNPVFDDQPSLSISHISFDPHHAGRVFATTGDVNISGYPFLGSGVYRSDDSGSTWVYTGLEGHGVLSKVFVDPVNPDIVYVGSMGYPSHRGDEKGLFRSIDGGQSWTKTLTINDSTGVIDMVVDPTQPGRIFASGWTRLRSNLYGTTVGPGTSLYRSDDYGETWSIINNGLPGNLHSRTSVEIANDGTLFISYIGTISDGVCAGYTESLKGLYRSIDAGMNWDTIQADDSNGMPCDLFGSFGWYFEALKVNPENSNDLFLLGVEMYRSQDAGKSWFEAVPPWWVYSVHADKHDLVFLGSDMYLATDGGAYKGNEFGFPEDWLKMENIPSTQFYRTAFNPHKPDQYFGGAQDNGTTGGNESFINEWPRIFGGDGFQPLFDPEDPSWMYALTQNGGIWFSQDTGQNFEWLKEGMYGANYWDMPFIMSPHDSKILFAASHVVFKINMDDTSRQWFAISPDLTKGDTILGNRYPAITALAQSALDELRLYAGTQDGKLWTSSDGGNNWIDLSDQTPGQYVTSITTSTVNPLGVFVTYSGYRNNDHKPYIYRSDDAGLQWVSLGVNIPMLGVNSFMILPEWDDEILFAGTDGGVYVSLNKGFMWERLGTNFPYMPVYDLDFNPVENTIIAGTFSRGIMTFPVEELDIVSGVDQEDDYHLLEGITVYPTIVNDEFIIDFTDYPGDADEFSLKIYSINGILVKSQDFSRESRYRVLIGKLNLQGIYILEISDDHNSILHSKIMVQ